MMKFDVVASYIVLPELETPYPVDGFLIHAATLKEAEFLLAFSGETYVEILTVIAEIDAPEIGGKLGELMDRFDPKNN